MSGRSQKCSGPWAKSLIAGERFISLVNNAGISGLSKIDDPDDSCWYDIVDTNLNGMYLITKEVLRHMPGPPRRTRNQYFIGIGKIRCAGL